MTIIFFSTLADCELSFVEWAFKYTEKELKKSIPFEMKLLFPVESYRMKDEKSFRISKWRERLGNRQFIFDISILHFEY